MAPDATGSMGAGVADRELRLGASFSGGVSLAIWMGGAASELQALTRLHSTSLDGVYGFLAETTRTRPVIDVLAGTSAGGINGAALALAMATGGDVSRLRELWLAEADLDKLLRPLTETHPPSVLRGDEVLGRTLIKGLRAVTGTAPHDARRHLRLTVPVTLLSPRTHSYADALGQTLSAKDHLGLIRFAEDDFHGPDAARRLAVAARASASYPVGFEPASIPVKNAPPAEWHGGTSLSGLARWGHSTWALDGGLLLNEPLSPVLEDVIDNPASGSVRRVVLQVSPVPAGGEPDGAENQRGDRPDLRQVMLDTVRIPWQQHLADEYRAVADHNTRVAEQQQRRRLIAARLASGNASGEEIRQAARALALRFAQRLVGELSLPGERSLTPNTNTDRWLEAIVDQRGAWLETVLWVPATVREAAFAVLDELRRQERRLSRDAASEDGLLARQDVRAAMASAPPGGQGIGELRHRLGEVISEMNALEQAEAGTWATSIAAARARNPEMDAAAVIESALPTVSLATDLDDAIVTVVEGAEQVGLILGQDTADPARSSAVFALLSAAAGGPRRAQVIHLVQLSASAWSCVGDEPRGLASHDTADEHVLREPSQKLRGLEFLRFGAFWKRSWRANDWMWGRLDAAAHLVPLLLDVDRLRVLYGPAWPAWLADRLEEVHGELPPDVDEELGVVEAGDATGRLVRTERWLISLRQRKILAEELPVLAAAIRADERQGSVQRHSQNLAENVEAGRDLATVLRAYHLDKESLDEHRRTPMGTDHSRSLMAVGASALVGVLPRPVRAVPWLARWVLVARARVARLRRRLSGPARPARAGGCHRGSRGPGSRRGARS